VRVDPTAAIAPERVERALAEVLPDLERVPGAAFRRVEWLAQLRYGWDAVNNGWNQWVLAYGPELQQSFLAWLGFKNTSWQELVTWMGALVVAILGVLAARLACLNRPLPPEPVQRAWLALCARLGAAGLARASHEGPLDFARRAAAALPAQAADIERLALRYAALRYGPPPSAAEVAAFRRAVAAFEVR
jgi:hypothetical protein